MTRSKHVIEQVLTGFEAKRNKRDNTRGGWRSVSSRTCHTNQNHPRHTKLLCPCLIPVCLSMLSSFRGMYITPFMDRYSRFTIDVVVARRPGFYTVKICLPFFMIVLMSLSVFAMDVSALNDRVGTGIEAALTATGAWDDGGVTGCYRV